MVTIKNRLIWIVLLPVGIIGIYLVVCIALYRIPAADETEYFEGLVLYKLNDSTGTNRQLFEELVMGNRFVRLDDESIWYVSERDHRILWPSNLDELRNRGYTIKTELKAQKLLFGGYSIAEIHELDKLKETPVIIN